jgi:hypothetical protein
MAWNWYGVKSLYRTRVVGKPKEPDKHYDAQSTMVEERVVLIHARSFEEAIQKGEREARIYASNDLHKNPFGQQVRCRFLGNLDAFCLFEAPGSKVEAFSSMIILPDSISNVELASIHFGSIEKHPGRRTKFLDASFSSKSWWKHKKLPTRGKPYQ